MLPSQMSFKKAFLVSWICYFPASQICNEFNLGIFFVSYGLDTTSTLEHVADTFRFYFFDPKHSRPAEIPLFLRVSWCSLFFIRDLSEIFLDPHLSEMLLYQRSFRDLPWRSCWDLFMFQRCPREVSWWSTRASQKTVKQHRRPPGMEGWCEILK